MIKIGLIGCGNIGSLVAERALGLKMKVLGYDPYLSGERALALGSSSVLHLVQALVGGGFRGGGGHLGLRGCGAKGRRPGHEFWRTHRG